MNQCKQKLLKTNKKIKGFEVNITNQGTRAKRMNENKKFRHISSSSKRRYPPNAIRNQKYRWYTLFFSVLAQQFNQFFNVFLFMICATQLKKEYLVAPLLTSVGPWMMVLMFSLFKEIVEDYKRYQRDIVTNSQLYSKLTDKGFVRLPSSKIKVGDLILLEKNERVPADIVLLKTSDISGQVFIRTDQLDGETDWKLKLTVPQVQSATFEGMKCLSVLAEQPNKDIYSFVGKIKIGRFSEDELLEAEGDNGVEEGFAERAERFLNFDFGNEKETSGSPEKPKSTSWVYSSRQGASENSMSEHSVSGDREYVCNGENVNEEIKKAIEKFVPSEEGRAGTVSDEKPSDVSQGNDVELNRTQSNEDISEASGSAQPLSYENMVWMNTVVATCSVLGCVVYTGKEAKAMLNTSKPRNKVGIIESELNGYMKVLGLGCALIALFFTYMRGFGSRSDIIAIRFLVLFSSVIPISLRVTVDWARYCYGRYISMDGRVDGAMMRSNGLPEELGRVSYFLTDKTGTLTKNEMEMKKIHLGTICYTKELNGEISKNLAKVLNSKSETKGVFNRGKKDINVRVYELVQALSVCHNVTPVVSENEVSYQASSPDEVAIVRWTECVGMKLYRRDRSTIIIRDPLNDEQEYKILHIFPFTSDTKRMGIIVRHNDEILFFLKGADAVMKRIIKSNDWVEEETDNMARDGLRTLVIAKKSLSEHELSEFEDLYGKARTNLKNRAEAVNDAIATIEKEMNVLGLTGVEDKLQDNVKVTLENLRNAGMKIWMLTGDKIETAISISRSSRIFHRGSTYLIISDATSAEEVRMKLDLLRGSDYNALVIDGQSLAFVIESCMDEFIKLASGLESVVGCRYTPTQKAAVARELKNTTKKCVCCIGDGGNDVSMITEANVGVGIVGKEGNQASLAADFSINKFCHVADLLFWHGRNSYQRTAKIAHLIIHRGLILTVIQSIFCSLLFFVPVGLFRGELMMMFITVYTFLPILSIVYSSDINREVVMKFPELYKELSENRLLSYRHFSVWTLIAFYQGTVMMITFYLWKQELFIISTLTFTSLIINELLMVALTAVRITPMMLIASGLSFIVYIIYFMFRKELLRYEKPFYLFVCKILVVNCLAILVSVAQRLWCKYMNPPTYSKLEVLV